MKIKQEKLIKKFLIEKFEEEKGLSLYHNQTIKLNFLIDNIRDKTKNQRKTLINTILPRIALYKMLEESDIDEASSYEYVRKYMTNFVASKKHSSIVKMEKVPGFYAIYRSIFLNIMRKTDLQKSIQEKGKNYFNITITKCLWHTACVENGCPNLCRLFCDVDDITYGGLKKKDFQERKHLVMEQIAVIFTCLRNSLIKYNFYIV